MRKACGLSGELYHKAAGRYIPCRSVNTGHDRARGVRWNEELQCFEMKCGRCYENRTHTGGGGYWPITPEFWSTTEGVQECRACIRERKRKYMARQRAKCTEPWNTCRCGKIDGRAGTKPVVDFEYVPERELVA